MTITTISSRELNQDLSHAKRAARRGPVFITDRGKPAHVLLSVDEYNRLARQGKSLADMFADGVDVSDIDLDSLIGRRCSLPRIVEFD